MRLIDADEVMRDAEHISAFRNALADLSDLAIVLSGAKTIDAAPMVHARWESCLVSSPNYYGLVFGWKCSACGYSFEDRSKCRKKPIFMKYCPHCGAKVDQEADDVI